MKKLSIILISALVAFASCTKSKEVHPEFGDGNDEIIKVSVKDVHVEFMRTDHEELQKVVFHYSPAEAQQFTAAEMTKREDCFELTLTNLLSDTLYSYFYELFPMSGNTLTTERKTFHTLVMDAPEPAEPPTPPSGVPEGAINGLFTINENGDQVYFSQGNLQYQASTNTWRFAEHQWDFVGTQTPETGEPGGTVIGSDNSLISSTYDGWIDLFGWGTSGWDHGAVCYQPWSTSYHSGDYYAYGSYNYNLNSQTGQADWGYNAISNGSNLPNQWRTLSVSEWDYVFNDRSPLSGIRYAKAVVNGVNGVILLPDNWNPAIHALNNTNEGGAAFTVNEITVTGWSTMESSGAVFLPAAGGRVWTSVSDVGSFGDYWSSSFNGGDCAHVYDMDFESSYLYMTWSDRCCGVSVRLVRLAE